MERPPLPRLVLYALAITLVVSIGIAASTSTAGFSPYNNDWDGTSDLRGLAGDAERVGFSTAAYTRVDSNRTVAFVIDPPARYDAEEAARVRSFVEAGGMLVVADAFGPHGGEPVSNELLIEVGATSRLDGDLLRDEQEYYRGPNLPVAGNVSNHTLTEDVSSITMNHGTAIEPGNATVLVSTSPYAYLDRDGNATVSGDETLESRPIATVEPVGDGTVVVVSDPSVFINAMLARSGNEAFAYNLVSARETVVFDHSQTPSQPPVQVALGTLRTNTGLQVALGVLAILGVWGIREWLPPGVDARRRRWIRRLDPFRWLRGADRYSLDQTPEPDVDALVATVRREHPDWDVDRIERLIAGTLGDSDGDRDDE